MTTIVLTHLDKLLREGLQALIERSDHLHVVACAPDEDDIHSIIETTRPSVVVMESGLPAYAFGRHLMSTRPELGIVIIGPRADRPLLRAALCSGARGYVLVTDDFRHLRDAIEQVGRGATYISPSLPANDVHEPLCAPLSEREWEVIAHLGNGTSIKAIASHLGISPRTVDTYRNRVMQKLHLNTVADIVRFSVCARVTTEQASQTGASH